MHKRNSKLEFFSLFAFLAILSLLLSNAFIDRIWAQAAEQDVYHKLEPIGVVLDIIQKEYVREADLDKLVEGALAGMMSSLDRHSSFIPAQDLTAMREETRGEFEGIGVSIKLDENENIMIFQPIPGSPAAEAGLRPFDIIIAIDDVSTEGLDLGQAAERIRGPRGEPVKITVLRPPAIDAPKDALPDKLDFNVKRDKVPLESVKEARVFDGGVGYMRISDFKDNTAADIQKELKKMLEQGMRAFVLDLRWNPGGLLTASKEVAQLFLDKNKLVTYTRGRTHDGQPSGDDLELYTEGRATLPDDFPMAILVNEQTASSSEIVTGALQFHKRAIIIGERTFGKGSVQTIIPLPRPENTALRLTTALYYTPAEVTIDGNGILPDVEVVMDWEQERALGEQMYHSYETNPEKVNEQNHGIAGEAPMEGKELAVDLQLQKAAELLRDTRPWNEIIEQYHKPVSETQITLEARKAHEAEEAQHAEAPASVQ